jgi:hypothetical protein
MGRKRKSNGVMMDREEEMQSPPLPNKHLSVAEEEAASSALIAKLMAEEMAAANVSYYDDYNNNYYESMDVDGDNSEDEDYQWGKQGEVKKKKPKAGKYDKSLSAD